MQSDGLVIYWENYQVPGILLLEKLLNYTTHVIL